MKKEKTSKRLRWILEAIAPFLLFLFVLFCIIAYKAKQETDAIHARNQQREERRRQEQEFNDTLQKARQAAEDYNNMRNRTGIE